MTLTENQILDHVGASFEALADLLQAEGPVVMSRPSLCEGWTVGHVVAHVTMAARYDREAFQQQLAAAGFDFGTLSNAVADKDAGLGFDRLLADLRSPIMAAWTPPGGGAMGALTHIVIHGLDITTDNDLPRAATDAATTLVLEALVEGGVAQAFGQSAAGLRLAPTDLDVELGEGRLVEAPAADLILALAGRPRPSVDLTIG